MMRTLCTSAALALWTSLAMACPIPVFQYALEHWPSDPYEITARIGDDASDGERQALALLQQASGGQPVANLNVTVEPAQGPAARMEVRYPTISRNARVVWEGELTEESARSLLSSPLRERIGEALAKRTTAVWLLVDGGDRQVDRDAEALLRRELARLEKETLIPETAEWGGQEVAIDHNVNFLVLRLRRDDPAEHMLLRMLLAVEADLETGFAGQPMVFPVYGRGLILYALVGRGTNPWTIEEAANFLTGPCSCQIKAANPGTDLLMSVDWTSRVQATTPATVGETVGTGSFLQRLEASETAEEGGAGEAQP